MDLIKFDSCNICYESIDHDYEKYKCSKCVFISHKTCVTSYFKQLQCEKCPLCKYAIEDTEVKCVTE